jgi:hypothetical protein
MGKVSFEIIKHEERLFFNDGEKYVLFDTGFIDNPFGKNSASVNGKIGPFSVKTGASVFFRRFINMEINGCAVTAVFNPMDGFDCLLAGNTLTISDEEITAQGRYFLEFADDNLPILEGSLNGKSCRFFFDSGARMTMIGEPQSEKIRTYNEWLAMAQCHADLDVYKVRLEFPCGFKYDGEGALVTHTLYQQAAAFMNIRAMLGIDIFNEFDMAILVKGAKRGVVLIERK